MKPIWGLRRWWHRQTDGEVAPAGSGDSPAFLISLLVHLCGLVVLGLIPVVTSDNHVTLLVDSLPEEQAELAIPEEFYFSEQSNEEIGAHSVEAQAMAVSLAPLVSEVAVVPSHVEMEFPVDDAPIQINHIADLATGLNYNANLAVKGAAGEGTTGAVGAIDRITHEILLSLEERNTLVVWLFDQTASLMPQRQAIHDRFERIYEELGLIQESRGEAVQRDEDKPLLTSIVAFGSGMDYITKQPTDDLAMLKRAVLDIPNDESGVENVFGAIYEAAKRYAEYRHALIASREPKRNVLLVVVTDEAGSDAQRLAETVKMCRRWAMPVYVMGVPAPFGRKEVEMKWVDPDPNYDQTPQWGIVEQGPESFLPERIKLGFSGSQADEQPIDSGFGPYALTRLCFESGGIYFAVHPNRNVARRVGRRETAAYSSHLTRFFDPEVMRRYRPEYVSIAEYEKRVNQNKARRALVQAASASTQLNPMENPRQRFLKGDEAAFANALSGAQQAAAALEPKINALYEQLLQGETDREKETVPRWQAGYDLAMGRVLATKVRTETYNAMLAAAKRGMKFKDEKNNTWVLQPADEISVGSQYAKLAERARTYLERVVDEHPDTPWAMLARQELADPLGWKWEEAFTDTSPPRARPTANGNAATPANDSPMMLRRPPPRRPLPKL